MRAPAPHAGRGALVHSHTAGATAFTLERIGSKLLARCSDTGTYLLDPAGGIVEVDPSGSAEIVEHRLLSMALPLVCAERGDVALHASGLVVEGQVVAFAGPAGRGKSTLAATGWALGYALVAEDGVVATLTPAGVVAWPGPLGIRTGGTKAVMPTTQERHADGPAALAALVSLAERGARITCERLEPAAAVPAILPSLIFGGSDRLPEALSAAARLAERVPVFRASMPDDLDALPAALEETLARVR